ncbi:MAG: DUF4136 domain-containing protein [Bryobacteraceae bacterium]
MNRVILMGIVCFAAAASAQEVKFDYDRSANFSNYKTYQWVDSKTGKAPNQLMDQNIKRAVDAQMALKGFQAVAGAADVQLIYQAAVDREKQFEAFGTGPRFYGSGRVTSTTIEVGKLVVDIYDSSSKQLVWSSSVSKTLDIKKDPDKNFANLQKAVAKMFKNYPPGLAGK